MKYKHIKSVAHNLGYSFLSDMNAVARDGRYVIVPELLFSAAARERVPQVRIDLFGKRVAPASMASGEVEESVANYAAMLSRLCADQNVDMAAVRGAEIILTFDYGRTRRTRTHPVREAQEFSCIVEILDDRGIVHRAEPDHWWWG